MVSYLWENFFRGDERERLIEEVLRNNYIFKDLTSREFGFVKKLIHYRTYRTGEPIFKQGELGVGMYIVVKGMVHISVEDLTTETAEPKITFVTRLGGGDFFGEIALIENGSRRTATATAAEDVAVLGFFKPDLAEILDRNPRIGVKILSKLSEVLARRLKETAERFTELKRELKEMTQQNASV